MADVAHASLRPGLASGVHVTQAWEVADAAARAALVIDATDEGRVCRQLDDSSFWLLRLALPATWAEIVSATNALREALLAQLPDGEERTNVLAKLDETLRLAGVVCDAANQTGETTDA